MRETENKKKMKGNERGITLIALVITIIVLLLLAGVAISMLTGENGIINKATEAEKENEVKTTEEKIKLAIMAAILDGYGDLKQGLGTLNKELGTNIENLPGIIEIDDKKYGINEDGSFNELKWTMDSNGVIKNEETGETFQIGDKMKHEDVIARLNPDEVTNSTAYSNDWLIIGIENGNLKLISKTKVATAKMGYKNVHAEGATYLEKARWLYRNLETELDNEAKSGSGISTARSVNVNDMQILAESTGIYSSNYGEMYRYLYSEENDEIYYQVSYDNGDTWSEETPGDYGSKSFTSYDIVIDSTEENKNNKVELTYTKFEQLNLETKGLFKKMNSSNKIFIANDSFVLANKVVTCYAGLADFNKVTWTAGDITSSEIFDSSGECQDGAYGSNVRAIINIQ